jgi:hypothetical protein
LICAKSLVSVTRTLKPAFSICVTHALQQPQAGDENTSMGGWEGAAARATPPCTTAIVTQEKACNAARRDKGFMG